MFEALRNLFGGKGESAAPQATRPRLSAEAWPDALYAVGDIHGCLDPLRALEEQIFADAAEQGGEAWIVYLGDFVDRGPESAGVLDRLTARAPKNVRRICLTGNHETMMLDYLANPRADADWLQFGGMETLFSYGLSQAVITGPAKACRAALASHIPDEHVAFLEGLALSMSVPGAVFVHAGLRSGVPLDQQVEKDLLWIRTEFFNAEPEPGRLVVHGHTPGEAPIVAPGRICIDTGVFATGRLTGVRLFPDGEPRFFTGTSAASNQQGSFAP
ncbi:hypothetical protein VE26_08125 [Devosia chinhatensis]|uniref:Calcineurin-like phosphoesterase domain-containing protein n=2 Tax=Devosia chinhatensis TaxID=429727 RepID=A0A0F5FLT1_9HYPH|nr:hypothetical protein VE26_08125 [Devosia chinhatensis]